MTRKRSIEFTLALARLMRRFKIAHLGVRGEDVVALDRDFDPMCSFTGLTSDGEFDDLTSTEH